MARGHKDDELLQPITPQQQIFIEHLLTGKNLSQAASLSDVSRRTATYWMADKDNPVRIEYERQRYAAQKLLTDRVARIHNLAFSALEDMLSPSTPPFIRMAALKMIYESQLSGLFYVRHPDSPNTLVRDEIDRNRKARELGGYNGVELYDDRGNERLEDE